MQSYNSSLMSWHMYCFAVCVVLLNSLALVMLLMLYVLGVCEGLSCVCFSKSEPLSSI